MNTPLSFTVTVTSCCNCPNADTDSGDCLHDYQNAALASNRWIQNVQRLTPSCPMIKQEESK